MTSYQYTDLAMSAFSNQALYYSISLTLVTAYLMTAYLAGAKLTRVQVAVLTTLYLGSSAVVVWVAFTLGMRGQELIALAEGISPSKGFYSAQIFSFCWNIIIIMVSIGFMLNVRHAKS